MREPLNNKNDFSSLPIKDCRFISPELLGIGEGGDGTDVHGAVRLHPTHRDGGYMYNTPDMRLTAPSTEELLIAAENGNCE